MRDFIRQTGQDRDYFREQNYPNTSENSLTFGSGSGKINNKDFDITDFFPDLHKYIRHSTR